ncbi:MAG: BrnT family toxin [Longimicrobiales bacterium]|nr:BrnT family toxin [Longimicrobiales bacterium]
MATDVFERLARCTGFDWDGGNAPKILARHGVSQGECEQVFFGEPLLVAADSLHSGAEERWAAWGRSADGRALAVVFTLRGERIRPISARDMNRKERRLYAQAEANDQADS